MQGATDDLITLGLRTLDYWEDSLNPEFLEPAMAEVMDDLMAVLWSHLKPHPYPFGQKVGKVAAKHQSLLQQPACSLMADSTLLARR